MIDQLVVVIVIVPAAGAKVLLLPFDNVLATLKLEEVVTVAELAIVKL